MTDPDPFDEIVRNLDLDLDFPEPEPAPEPPAQPTHPSVVSSEDDDPFYRRVEPRPVLPRDPRMLFAWLGALGGPLAIIVTGFFHVIMPRPILLGCGLLFVASAIYLISQLPERGPAEPWWPDDGAEL